MYFLIAIAIAVYLSYMIGLYRVLKRLGAPAWQAFIPVFNFLTLVRAVGAPTRWFYLALVPYFGAVYSGSVAIRLGAIFGRGVKFSLFWLIFGAFIGMHVIARSPTFDKELQQKRLTLMDVRGLKKQHKQDSKPLDQPT